VAIKKDKAAVSVDFAYEDDKSKELFKIKLHQSKEFDRTISICGDIGSFEAGEDVYMALPASLFFDVVDFLRENRYVEPAQSKRDADNRSEKSHFQQSTASNRSTAKTTKNSYGLPLPVVDGVSMPNSSNGAEIEIASQEEQNSEPDGHTDDLEKVGHYDVRPIQSLLTPYDEDISSEHVEESNSNVGEDVGGEQEEEYQEELLEEEEYQDGAKSSKTEELKKMAEERATAKAKAKDKKISKVKKKSVRDYKKQEQEDDDEDDNEEYNENVEDVGDANDAGEENEGEGS
jgi:hypothetical protein